MSDQRDGENPESTCVKNILCVSHVNPWLVPLLLAIHAALLAYGARVHSPTLNEPAHLAAGVFCWRFDRYDVYSVNPPLVRMVAAVPVMLSGCDTDWGSFREGPGARPELAIGNDFCAANGERTVWLVTIARWACIPFSLIGGYTCFRWGREMYGPPAGALSLALWCFCPSMIAHGQLITCDMAATSFAVAASYMFWRLLRLPSWRRTVGCGLALGVAALCKTTLLLLFPLWPALWIAYRLSDPCRPDSAGLARQLAMILAALSIALVTINAFYEMDGTMTPLRDYQFVSRSLAGGSHVKGGANRFAGSPLGAIPVPLPKCYLTGIDLQRHDFESYGHPFYLGGTWSKTGWWYYYLYAMAIKVPLGTWLLVLAAAAVRLSTRVAAGRRDELVLLTPPLLIFAVVSSQTGLNEHMRYVVPIFPFLFIYAGISLSSACALPYSAAGALARCAVAAAAIWSASSSLACYPHSLSYFNELAGGPRNGWKHLSSSNLDWGQDLLFLKQWADSHPGARPLRIMLFGSINPKLVNINGDPCVPYANGPELEPGYYAVSYTLLAGYAQPGHQQLLARELDRARYSEVVGGSIVVFYKAGSN